MMNDTVLLVYPKIPTTYWSFEYVMPYIGARSLMPPLGLLTVASLIPAGYTVKLIDMNVHELTAADVSAADIVFVSAMIVQKESFEQVVALCNERGVPVAAGGPYPTSSFEAISGVDYFILNEGEVTLPRFFADWEAGAPAALYRDDTKPDLSRTPPPRYDLIDVKDYSSMALQFSRGCPFSCEFCDIIEMFGRKPRYKETAQFLREIEAVYDTGFRGPVFVVDDNFIGNPGRVKTFLKELKAWQVSRGFPFAFYTEASVNLAGDDELMDLMADAGFEMVFLGIETTDVETLQAAHKMQNARMDLMDSVKKIQARGIEVMAGFIVGFDTDRDDVFDRQIRFIRDAGIPLAMVGILIALPGTRLYRRLRDEGRLLGETGGNNTHQMEANFTPVMPAHRLREGYRRVLSEIYQPKRYFQRCFAMIRSFPGRRRTPQKPLDRRDITALYRSLRTQLFSPYGSHYASLLLKTLLYRPSLFPLAVNLAIKGSHFFAITAETLSADDLGREIRESADMLESAIVRGEDGGRRLSARQALRRVVKVKEAVQRKYRKQSAVVRRELAAAIHDFDVWCETLIACCMLKGAVEGDSVL